MLPRSAVSARLLAVAARRRAGVGGRGRDPCAAVRSIALAEACCFAWLVSSAWLMYLAQEERPTGIASSAVRRRRRRADVLSSRPLGSSAATRGRRTTRGRSSGGPSRWRSSSPRCSSTRPGWAASRCCRWASSAASRRRPSAWSLGIDVRSWRWAEDFLRSGTHVGLLAGVAVAGLADELAVGVHVLRGHPRPACCSAAARRPRSTACASASTSQDDRLVRSTRAAEHRQGAHWLHDDVSAHLGLAKLRLRQDDRPRREDVGAWRSTTWTTRSGCASSRSCSSPATVRLAEVLQPYVRRAQNEGVTIEGVPSFEDASLIVDVDVGRLFGRAAAILTSNALNAGATTLSYGVHHNRRRDRAEREGRRRWLRAGRRSRRTRSVGASSATWRGILAVERSAGSVRCGSSTAVAVTSRRAGGPRGKRPDRR